MNSTYLSIGMTALGFIANLVWMLINLRVRDQVREVEGNLTKQIADLKTWMDNRYLIKEQADERHVEILRRLAALEK